MTVKALLTREVTRQDFARWRVLWDGYNAFYGRVADNAVPGYITELTWQRFLDPEMPVHALVAEQAGELVRIAHYLFHLSTTSLAPACYLRDLYTSGRTRGQGVATALIEAVGVNAKTAGSPSIYWQTHETNDVARGLYDKVAVRSGFIVYQKQV